MLTIDTLIHDFHVNFGIDGRPGIVADPALAAEIVAWFDAHL